MFKNGISQNTGKCKLGWFSLSQSQIIICGKINTGGLSGNHYKDINPLLFYTAKVLCYMVTRK